MKTCVNTLTLMLTVGLSLASLHAGQPEWPQFRGPGGSGSAAADARPATNWSSTQNVKWKVA
ncbi:MAG: hypothetical protein WCQ21_08625, partial [Verrucomicrobiota bacterium]